MNRLEAGHAMKQARDALGYTQAQIEQKSIEMFGEEGRISQSWLSKVEGGRITRQPDMQKLVRLGQLYGLSPTQIYEMWELPTRGLLYEEAGDERMKRAVKVFNDLPDGPVREQFLNLIDLAVNLAVSTAVRNWRDK